MVAQHVDLRKKKAVFFFIHKSCISHTVTGKSKLLSKSALKFSKTMELNLLHFSVPE